MRVYWQGILGQVLAQQKRFLRDKTALFFTFLFPIIFLLIFGSIFNNQSASLDIAVINHSDTDVARTLVDSLSSGEEPVLNVVTVSDLIEAREKMGRSEISGIIELPVDFGTADQNGRAQGVVKVLYQKGSEESGQMLEAIVAQMVDGINKGLGQPEPPVRVQTEVAGDEALTNFDYTYTGLLAFTILSMSMFSLANDMPGQKQKGSYRRLRAAPFTSVQLITAMAIHYILITLLSVLTMLLVGFLVFDFHIRGSWLVFTVFTILSVVMTTGFGLLVGGWAKNENQSSPLSNLIAFPMMFLSGVFFPTFLFPDWLQVVSASMPLSPVVEGFRMIMTENASLLELARQVGLIGIWTVFVYVVTIKLFRWE